MFKKYIPFFTCVFALFILILISFEATGNKHINTYPNLPAPIGEEKILITSAGQAAEGTIVRSIADSLNLDADYRPRALGTDLYDYNSVVIVLGFSPNGLAYTNKTFQAELTRTKHLVKEADISDIPVILVNLSGAYREDKQTWSLFEQTAAYANYYIGLKNMRDMNQYLDKLHSHSVPLTLVNQLDDIQIPFNSVFR